MTKLPHSLKSFSERELGSAELWIIRMLLAATVIIVACFPRLWLVDREVPAVPLLDVLTDVASVYHRALFFLYLFMGILGVLRPKSILIFLSILLLWGMHIFLDLLRLQPFFYYAYACILVIHLEGRLKGANDFNTLRAMNFAIYFWPGLTKFNYGFVNDLFPWLIAPFVTINNHLLLTGLALGAAAFEFLAGIFLLFKSTRNLSVAMIALIHVAILFFYGPLGRSHHAAVLPWSVVQIPLVWFLFYGSKVSWRDILFPRQALGAIARVVFILVPILSIWGLWPVLFSFRLYSVSALHANLVVDKSYIEKSHLPLDTIWNKENGGIPVPSWTMMDTGSFYISEYYYRGLFKQICRKKNPEENIKFMINYHLLYHPLFIPNKQTDRQFTCSDFGS